MSIDSLDLNLLRVFDAIMAERNVSRAAERLFLSQPAVSHALSRLRHVLKDELFIKASGGMRPTPRAAELAGPVNEALNALEQAFSPTEFNPQVSDRRFRIATHDYLVTVLMADLAAYLSKHAPRISVRIRPTQGRALEMLDLQEADMAISAFGDLPERFEQRLLFRDTYVCVMRTGHPLSKKPLTIKQFAGARHLLISPRGDERGFIDDALAARNMSRHVAMVINQFSPAGRIIASSDMILTVPERIARHHAAAHSLHICQCPVAAPEVFSETSLIWHKRLGRHPAFTWLQDVLAGLCTETMG